MTAGELLDALQALDDETLEVSLTTKPSPVGVMMVLVAGGVELLSQAL